MQEMAGLVGKIGEEERKIHVPLLGVQLQAKVEDFVASVELLQYYKNTEDSPIEAVYHFPVDASASVCGFSAEFDDGTIVSAEVKKKEEARQLYEDAMAEGKSAQLLEAGAPDVFTLSIGTLPSGAYITIRIKYITTLKAEGKASRFLVPTFIAARFSPSPPLQDHGASLSVPAPPSSRERHYGLKIRVSFFSRSKIKTIFSPTHCSEAVVHYESERKASAVLSEINMERDVVLLCEEEQPHEPRACIEVSDNGSLAGIVTLFPNIAFRDVQREVVFVIDRSGSMRRKMAQTKEALSLFLHSLPPSSSFNIVGFGSSFQPLFEKSTPYSDASLAAALAYANEMEADMGGTNILQPLQHVLSQPLFRPDASQAVEREVFVLTDGQVSNDIQVFSLIRHHCQKPSAEESREETTEAEEKEERGAEDHRAPPPAPPPLPPGATSPPPPPPGCIPPLSPSAAAPRGSARVFALGLGRSASHHLVEGMARAGRGTACFCIAEAAESSRDLRTKVIQQLRHALQPSLDNVTVTWNFPPPPTGTNLNSDPTPNLDRTMGGGSDRDGGAEPTLNVDSGCEHRRRVQPIVPQCAPSRPQPVFNRERFLSFALFPEDMTEIPQSVTVKTESPDGPLEVRLPITDEEVTRGTTIHKLAVRAAIREAEETVVTERDEDAEARKRAEVEAMAMTHGLACSLTSFVAVRTRAESEHQPGSRHEQTRVIPQFQGPSHITCEAVPRAARRKAKKGGGGGGGGDVQYKLERSERQHDSERSACCGGGGGSESEQLERLLLSLGMDGGATEEASLGMKQGERCESREEGEEQEARQARMQRLQKESETRLLATPSLKEHLAQHAAVAAELERQAQQQCAEIHKALSRRRLERRGNASGRMREPEGREGGAQPREGVVQLCMLQKADGSFELGEALAAVMGMTLETMREAASKVLGPERQGGECESRRVWGTAWAVVGMQLLFASERETWELQEDKAQAMLLRHQVTPELLKECLTSWAPLVQVKGPNSSS